MIRVKRFTSRMWEAEYSRSHFAMNKKVIWNKCSRKCNKRFKARNVFNWKSKNRKSQLWIRVLYNHLRIRSFSAVSKSNPIKITLIEAAWTLSKVPLIVNSAGLWLLHLRESILPPIWWSLRTNQWQLIRKTLRILTNTMMKKRRARRINMLNSMISKTLEWKGKRRKEGLGSWVKRTLITYWVMEISICIMTYWTNYEHKLRFIISILS